MATFFDYPFRVCRWTAQDTFIEEVAGTTHFTMADALWATAQEVWPNDIITLQHGIRVIKRSEN
jgi:hypothetical protein